MKLQGYSHQSRFRFVAYLCSLLNLPGHFRYIDHYLVLNTEVNRLAEEDNI